jgi:hypothetical protein
MYLRQMQMNSASFSGPGPPKPPTPPSLPSGGIKGPFKAPAGPFNAPTGSFRSSGVSHHPVGNTAPPMDQPIACRPSPFQAAAAAAAAAAGSDRVDNRNSPYTASTASSAAARVGATSVRPVTEIVSLISSSEDDFSPASALKMKAAAALHAPLAEYGFASSSYSSSPHQIGAGPASYGATMAAAAPITSVRPFFHAAPPPADVPREQPTRVGMLESY